jgi:hypothetical protein
MIAHGGKLDMQPDGDPLVIKLNQYDKNYNIIISLLSNKGRFEIETGTTAKMVGTRPDGSPFETNASLSGTVVMIRENEALTEIPGFGTYEICLTHNGKELYSKNFTVVVERAPVERGAGN